MTSWILQEYLANIRKIDNFNLVAVKQIMLETEFLKVGLAKYVPEQVITLLFERLQRGFDGVMIFGQEETAILKDAKESTKVQLMCFH